jgi:hypothetical protein
MIGAVRFSLQEIAGVECCDQLSQIPMACPVDPFPQTWNKKRGAGENILYNSVLTVRKNICAGNCPLINREFFRGFRGAVSDGVPEYVIVIEGFDAGFNFLTFANSAKCRGQLKRVGWFLFFLNS